MPKGRGSNHRRKRKTHRSGDTVSLRYVLRLLDAITDDIDTMRTDFTEIGARRFNAELAEDIEAVQAAIDNIMATSVSLDDLAGAFADAAVMDHDDVDGECPICALLGIDLDNLGDQPAT